MNKTVFLSLAVFLLLSISAYSNDKNKDNIANIEDGLILYYPFEGDAKDHSGYNNHGTLMNLNRIQFVDAKIGKGIKLTGYPALFSDQGGHVLIPVVINDTSKYFTINFWTKYFNHDGPGPEHKGVFIHFGEEHGSYCIAVSENRFSFYFGKSLDVPENHKETFFMFTAMYCNGFFKSYFNGILLDSGEAKPIKLQKQYAAIGRHWWDYTYNGNRIKGTATRLNAIIDEVRIYNRCLSDEEIKTLYNGIKITPKISTNSPICTGDNLMIFTDSIPDAEYFWEGPNGFSSNEQNVIIKNAMPHHSGEYKLYVRVSAEGMQTFYSDTVSVNIVVATTLVSPGDSSLIFVGEARRTDNYIQLTDAKLWNGGSVWLKNRFTVKVDFSTTFGFMTRKGDNATQTEEKSIPGADGIAFVMQNHNYPVLGEIGGAMGYTGITNSLAVEIDLYHNDYDPNGNHIAVQTMGSKRNTAIHDLEHQTLGMNPDMIEIEHDKMYYAKIEYEWTAKKMKIFVDSTGEFNIPVLTIDDIDLTKHLMLEDGEYVYLGITSGTGKAFQEHLIYNWEIPCNNQLVGVEDYSVKKVEDEFVIYPNPSRNTALIEYKSDDNSNANISILNIYGQLIIENQKLTPGNGKLLYSFDTTLLTIGTYYVLLKTPTVKMTKRLVVIR